MLFLFILGQDARNYTRHVSLSSSGSLPHSTKLRLFSMAKLTASTRWGSVKHATVSSTKSRLFSMAKLAASTR